MSDPSRLPYAVAPPLGIIMTLRSSEELQDRTVELARLEFHAVGGAGKTTPHFMEASSTCSSSSEERLWRECLNCFGGSAARKAAQLHDDITCLSHGLKPASSPARLHQTGLGSSTAVPTDTPPP